MARIVELNIVALFAVALSGCSMDDETMMSDYAYDLGQHLDALESEQLTHATEVGGASDLDSVSRAEDEHERRMNDHMDRMDGVMGDMMSCTDGRGNRVDTTSLARMMQEMRSTGDQHHKAMRAAATLEACQMEELRHRDAARDRLTGMRGHMGMLGQGNAYHCGHCAHCGM